MIQFRTLALFAGAAVALAACGGGDNPPPPDANVTEITVPETESTLNVSTEEPAPATVANVATPTPEAAPPPAFSDEDQTRADAAATGMTARVDRSEGNDSAVH